MDNKIEIIEKVGMKTCNNGKRVTIVKCKCYCDEIFETYLWRVNKGRTKSCGCYQKKRASEANTTHGMSNTRIFMIWAEMIRRCTDKNDKSYVNYAGRGIAVCQEWFSFDNFYNDMWNGYDEKLTLGRIDNDKGYSKENCRWENNYQQARNKRNVPLFKIDGVFKCIAEWSEISGVHPETIRSRIKKLKWEVKEAVFNKPRQ